MSTGKQTPEVLARARPTPWSTLISEDKPYTGNLFTENAIGSSRSCRHLNDNDISLEDLRSVPEEVDTISWIENPCYSVKIIHEDVSKKVIAESTKYPKPLAGIRVQYEWNVSQVRR